MVLPLDQHLGQTLIQPDDLRHDQHEQRGRQEGLRL
jgi:hypothetical protein